MCGGCSVKRVGSQCEWDALRLGRCAPVALLPSASCFRAAHSPREHDRGWSGGAHCSRAAPGTGNSGLDSPRHKSEGKRFLRKPGSVFYREAAVSHSLATSRCCTVLLIAFSSGSLCVGRFSVSAGVPRRRARAPRPSCCAHRRLPSARHARTDGQTTHGLHHTAQALPEPHGT